MDDFEAIGNFTGMNDYSDNGWADLETQLGHHVWSMHSMDMRLEQESFPITNRHLWN